MPDLSPVLADLAACVTYGRGRGLYVAGRWLDRPAATIALRDLVYARHFCHWAPGPNLAPHVSGDAAFVADLGAATGGARYWDHGWKVVSAGPTWAFVSSGQIMLFAAAPDLLWPRGAAPGEPVAVQVPCARENLSPGFFYLISAAGRFDREGPYPRFYLNVAPGAAPDLVAALVETLEDVPFEAKFANDPAAYCRVDPAVLYTAAPTYADIRAALLELVRNHPDWWRDGTPLFSFPLATGLAAAECPPDGGAAVLESFGHQRCRLLAIGILDALEAAEPAALLAHIAAAFAAAGLDLAEPHRQHLPAEFW